MPPNDIKTDDATPTSISNGEKREIKFRAWDKINKMMWLVTELNWRPPSQGQNIFYKRGVYGPEEKPIGGHDLYVKDEDIILMQFTALRDRHGKEIYEDDIVDYSFYGSLGEDKHIGKVVIDSFWGFRVNGKSLVNDYCEVIGNIYENPNLLPVGSTNN